MVEKKVPCVQEPKEVFGARLADARSSPLDAPHSLSARTYRCLVEVGACCLGTACSIATAADCLDAGGTFFGPDTTCDSPDADGDGLRNECDGCPADSNKIEPGACGCGVDDSADSDGDGVPDCRDICPGADDAAFGDCTDAIPTVSVWGLVVLALLLSTAGKVFFSRRPATSNGGPTPTY